MSKLYRPTDQQSRPLDDVILKIKCLDYPTLTYHASKHDTLPTCSLLRFTFGFQSRSTLCQQCEENSSCA